MIANPHIIKMLATRKKCWMCKHKFNEAIILPVKNPQQGRLQPNYNAEVLFHMYDTHGLDPEIIRAWIFGCVYDLELTEMGIKKNIKLRSVSD